MFEYQLGDFPKKATLCYVFDGSEVLMMEKKTGHGEGKIVGPGGTVEPYDTSVRHAATRETVEETAVVPYGLEKVGKMGMVFNGEPSQYIEIFSSEGHIGEPQETEEGVPAWYDTENLPYSEMWDADEEWMPEMLEGGNFEAEFFFDDDYELQDKNFQLTEF
jgi:8-oxo-dGTP diphosphatase